MSYNYNSFHPNPFFFATLLIKSVEVVLTYAVPAFHYWVFQDKEKLIQRITKSWNMVPNNPQVRAAINNSRAVGFWAYISMLALCQIAILPHCRQLGDFFIIGVFMALFLYGVVSRLIENGAFWLMTFRTAGIVAEPINRGFRKIPEPFAPQKEHGDSEVQTAERLGLAHGAPMEPPKAGIK